MISEMSTLGGNNLNMKFKYLPFVSEKLFLKSSEKRQNLSREKIKHF